MQLIYVLLHAGLAATALAQASLSSNCTRDICIRGFQAHQSKAKAYCSQLTLASLPPIFKTACPNKEQRSPKTSSHGSHASTTQDILPYATASRATSACKCLATPHAKSCTKDSCLDSFSSHAAAASRYCHHITFTPTGKSTKNPLTAACTGSHLAQSMSSACSCLYGSTSKSSGSTSPTSKPTPPTTSTPITSSTPKSPKPPMTSSTPTSITTSTPTSITTSTPTSMTTSTPTSMMTSTPTTKITTSTPMTSSIITSVALPLPSGDIQVVSDYSFEDLGSPAWTLLPPPNTGILANQDTPVSTPYGDNSVLMYLDYFFSGASLAQNITLQTVKTKTWWLEYAYCYSGSPLKNNDPFVLTTTYAGQEIDETIMTPANGSNNWYSRIVPFYPPAQNGILSLEYTYDPTVVTSSNQAVLQVDAVRVFWNSTDIPAGSGFITNPSFDNDEGSVAPWVVTGGQYYDLPSSLLNDEVPNNPDGPYAAFLQFYPDQDYKDPVAPSSISQNITLPRCDAGFQLSFYSICGGGYAYIYDGSGFHLDVTMDNVHIFGNDYEQPQKAWDHNTPDTFNIGPGQHTLTFEVSTLNATQPGFQQLIEFGFDGVVLTANCPHQTN